MRKYIISLIFSAVAFFVGLQNVSAQCAMCRATIENNVSAGETSVAAGLNFGIMYLFAAPYLAIMVIAFFWYKKSKSNAKRIRPGSRFEN